MAKLYAELISDKGGRIASKSGDDCITVELYRGNTKSFRLRFNEHGQLTADCLHGPNAGYSCSVLWEEYQGLNKKERKNLT